MDKNIENSRNNMQDGPHQEGTQNNIAQTGQTAPNNNNRSMNEMMNEGEGGNERQKGNTGENPRVQKGDDNELKSRH